MADAHASGQRRAVSTQHTWIRRRFRHSVRSSPSSVLRRTPDARDAGRGRLGGCVRRGGGGVQRELHGRQSVSRKLASADQAVQLGAEVLEVELRAPRAELDAALPQVGLAQHQQLVLKPLRHLLRERFP
eukprot:3236204-Rhodomonas_salina.1